MIRTLRSPAALLLAALAVPVSAGTARAGREDLVALGESLFFDVRLSGSGTVSCASCHRPESSFADPRRFSSGHEGALTSRNAPTLINRPLRGYEFWDGRSLSLAGQVLHPLQNPDEMGLPAAAAAARLSGVSGLGERFERVFGDPAITPERLATSIATYVASLRFERSAYRLERRGGGLSPAVARGESLFLGEAGCGRCHTGESFTDERFHNTGVSWRSGAKDAGRGGLTGRQEEMRAFKTPTLLELVRTAPYMHDGSLATLEDVVNHYLQGGAPEDPALDPGLAPLDLGLGDVADLLAFLRSLSGPDGPPFGGPAETEDP
jgi:cytochrome c peroxidase